MAEEALRDRAHAERRVSADRTSSQDANEARSQRSRTALVLSGGGVRGAYEVGVVQGIIEILGLRSHDESPFSTFTGTSVGAINATYLAANADRGDLAISNLVEMWARLRLDVQLRFKLRELVLGPRWLGARGRAPEVGWSILDAVPLEHLVGEGIAWSTLHENVRAGVVRALVVAALDVATGRTTMFAELGDGVPCEPSRDPSRTALHATIGRDHVLASAAIPLLFPARKIDGAYYCDGGLRFNTPLAPAIRTGADRLVVVSLLPAARSQRLHEPGYYPDLGFLIGKLFNVLLADPIVYDLQVVERFNRLLDILERSMDRDEMERVQDVMVETRGARYQRLETLVFRPSRDLGVMAGEHLLRDRRPTEAHHRGGAGWVMKQVVRRSRGEEADWASYVMFDGAFAAELIELGRQDARARGEDIRRFFSPTSPSRDRPSPLLGSPRRRAVGP